MKKLIISLVALSPSAVLASSASLLKDGADSAKNSHQSAGLLGDSAHPGAFNTIANVLIGLSGAAAVLVLIAGGFMYVTSNGDAKRVTQAKDTILYAIIGIVVVILAYAIVGFVTGSLTK